MKKLILLFGLLLLLSGCSNWKGIKNVQCNTPFYASSWSGKVVEETDHYIMVSGPYEQYDSEGVVIYSGDGIIAHYKAYCSRGGKYLKDELMTLEMNEREIKYTKRGCIETLRKDGNEGIINGMKAYRYPSTYFLTKHED